MKTIARLAALALLFTAADSVVHHHETPLDESVYRYGDSPPVYGHRLNAPMRAGHHAEEPVST
jgi:hypothetical protein